MSLFQLQNVNRRGKLLSIPKAFNTLEHKEMTLEDFEAYYAIHPYQKILNAMVCCECGDQLVFCKGKHNIPYFKHSPETTGHSYCSLYHEGPEPNTCESLLRKRLFKEKDILVNFELRYSSGCWKSFITIPPFDSQ